MKVDDLKKRPATVSNISTVTTYSVYIELEAVISVTAGMNNHKCNRSKLRLFCDCVRTRPTYQT